MTIDKKIIDKLMKDYKSPEDIFGKNGVFKELQKAILERILEGEITHHQNALPPESDIFLAYVRPPFI